MGIACSLFSALLVHFSEAVKASHIQLPCCDASFLLLCMQQGRGICLVINGAAHSYNRWAVV
jgi:hypothetical protein